MAAPMDQIEAIRAHVEANADKERAMFSMIGIKALLAAVDRPAISTSVTEIGYTNWRGEFAVRRIVPNSLWFGTTEWHRVPQWIITAHDVDKDVERDFALSGFQVPICDETDSQSSKPVPIEQRAVHRIAHDGFEGEVIGSYITREGKRGVVLQQIGTKVVHVYGEKWL